MFHLQSLRIGAWLLMVVLGHVVAWGAVPADDFNLHQQEVDCNESGEQNLAVERNLLLDSASDVALSQPLALLPTSDIALDFATSSEGYYDDAEVVPSQAILSPLGPAMQSLPLTAMRDQNPRTRTNRPGAALGLASVPFMLGDTGAGTCFSLRGIITADISHPSLTCSRLNVSEANTALPVDRFYYSYRHFENSSGVRAFQYSESFNLDRHMLGTERTFMEGMGSVEFRLPIEYRMRSDILSLISPADGVVDIITGSDDRETALGNISVITKMLMIERRAFALSAGLGVSLPTSRDVDYDIGVRDTILFPIAPGVTGETLAVFENTYENRTVYLSPFLAWLYAPESRWYHQGFLQFEVAANPSKLTTVGGGVTDFYFNGAPIGDVVYRTPGGLPTETDVFAQTIMRANLGLGYRLTDRDEQRWISNLRGLLELHYTTTLQDGILSPIAIEQIGFGAFFEQSASAGNANRRADHLNAAIGLSADVGPLVVTNGVVAPIRTGNDRGFDFEYNCQVQLPY